MTDLEKKMISMVDFDSFFEAVKVTVESPETTIQENYVRKYLEEWAKAKSRFFEMFGEKLWIESDTSLSVDEEQIKVFLDKLWKDFPQYASISQFICTKDFLSNSISEETMEDPFLCMFPKIFSKGKKLTKALSEFFNDYTFDVALSVILQNRQVSGVSRVSIHPLDYITISTSGHKWQSCMEITGKNNGFNKVGGFSLMMDNSSLVAYVANRELYTIQNDGGSFDWYNKINRSLVFISESGNTVYFGHKIGNIDSSMYDSWFMSVKNVLGNDKKWRKKEEGGYTKKVGNFYYDSYCSIAYIANGINAEDVQMGVKNLWCVHCGEKFDDLIQYKGFLVHKSELKGGK